MNEFDFVLDPSNRVVTVRAADVKKAHALVWAGLSENEKNACASMECVEVRPYSGRGELSEIHRRNHAATLTLARRARANPELHSRLMAMAERSRFYFSQFRNLEL